MIKGSPSTTVSWYNETKTKREENLKEEAAVRAIATQQQQARHKPRVTAGVKER